MAKTAALVGVACSLIGIAVMVAGLIASGAAAAKNYRRQQRVLQHTPEQQARADAIRAEMAEWRLRCSNADPDTAQSDYDLVFHAIVNRLEEAQ